MKKKQVLIVTQSLPSETGHGAAMRLGNIIKALATASEVTLLCVTADSAINVNELQVEWRKTCAEVFFFNLSVETKARTLQSRRPLVRLFTVTPKIQAIWPNDEVVAKLEPFKDRKFDLVYVIRLRMVPIWRMLEARLNVAAKECVLDLDDIESVSHSRQTKLQGTTKLGRLGYVLEAIESLKLANQERVACKTMDRVLICSKSDQALLRSKYPQARIDVVPNTIRIPLSAPPKTTGPTLEILFVGTLSYHPNEDAVRWAADEIIPKLKESFPNRNVIFKVVGRHPTAWMQEYARTGTLELFADVPDVGVFYESCDLVVVPIRAGGGTRIKILEAFGYGRLVISTTLGAEGLDVEDQRDLLIADTPSQFVAALQYASMFPEKTAEIVRHARKTLESNYSQLACTASVLGHAVLSVKPTSTQTVASFT